MKINDEQRQCTLCLSSRSLRSAITKPMISLLEVGSRSFRYCSAIDPLSFAIDPPYFRYRFTLFPLSFRYRSAIFSLSFRFRSAIIPLSVRNISAIDPLFCRYIPLYSVYKPNSLSFRYSSATDPPSVH